MTKHTAEEWAKAEFARHEDGMIAVRSNPEARHPWVAGPGWASDAELASDPGWSIVRDAESLTAREHQDAAWEKAHVVRRIPAGAGYICKWDEGDIEAEPDGHTYEMLARGTFSERRLLDPPAPAWHNARIIEAWHDDNHDTVRWARADNGTWLCLAPHHHPTEAKASELRDVDVIIGADEQTKGQDR